MLCYHCITLIFVALRCVVLCCAVLCCVVLRCVVLRSVVLCCAAIRYETLRCVNVLLLLFCLVMCRYQYFPTIFRLHYIVRSNSVSCHKSPRRVAIVDDPILSLLTECLTTVKLIRSVLTKKNCKTPAQN